MQPGWCEICQEQGYALELFGFYKVYLCVDCLNRWHDFIFDQEIFIEYQHTSWEWEYLGSKAKAGIFSGFIHKKIHRLMDERRNLEIKLRMIAKSFVRREKKKRRETVVDLATKRKEH